MKKNNHNIMENQSEKWVSQAMNSLEGIKRANANPFLYTRILARMQEANSRWEKMARFISRPAFAIAATALFLALNMWVVIQKNDKAFSQAEKEQLFATEYSITSIHYSLVDPNEVK
jgi:hypothetical protein